MSRFKSNMEGMLFQYGTTSKTDYRPYEMKAPLPTTFKEKPKRARAAFKPIKDVHTMTTWQSHVPFYLLHKPKEVVRTNPYNIQQAFEKPKDTGREEAQRTRPRLVMTPAVSMDDIDNSEAREILCDDMYTSTAAAGLREAVKPYFRVAAPFPGNTAKSNPVVLPKYKPPVVPKEWRMESVEWDNKQLRCHCDPTKDFWLMYPLPKCRACNESAIVKKHRDAKLLARRH